MGDLSKHFSRHEFYCRCGSCTPIAVDYELIEVLEGLRTHCGKQITITSAYRCPKHNKKVGGRKSSKHILGIAADIQVSGFNPRDIAKYFRTKYPNKYGVGDYSTFTHIDVRHDKGRW